MKRFLFILTLMVIVVFNVFAEENVFSYYPNGEIRTKFLWKDNELSSISGGFYDNNKLIERIDKKDLTVFLNSPDSNFLKMTLKNLYLDNVIEIELKESRNTSSGSFYDVKNNFISREFVNTAESTTEKVYWDEKNLKELHETTDNTSISKFYNKNGVLISEVTATIGDVNKDNLQNLNNVELLKSDIKNNMEIKEYYENTGTLKSIRTIINGKESLIEYNEDGKEKSNTMNNLTDTKIGYLDIIFKNVVRVILISIIIFLIKKIFKYFKNK